LIFDVISSSLMEVFGLDLEIAMYNSSLRKTRTQLGLVVFLEADPIVMQQLVLYHCGSSSIFHFDEKQLEYTIHNVEVGKGTHLSRIKCIEKPRWSTASSY
jgi:hypothetical protein